MVYFANKNKFNIKNKKIEIIELRIKKKPN